MSVVKLVLAYDGTDFHGWARQPGQRTIEGELVRVLETVLREPPTLSVAGRTDAGVHARGQEVSFAAEIEPSRIQRVVNGALAPEVVVVWASHAPDGFDARFSATAREYRYRIDAGPIPDPFTARYIWHRPGELRVSAMRAAARALVGEQDFASFGRAPNEGGDTVRRLEKLTVFRRGDRLEIVARANAFIQQMVRSLVGTLVDVGDERIDPRDVPAILQARDRARAGRVAPPHGLTLERAVYAPGGRPAMYRAGSPGPARG